MELLVLAILALVGLGLLFVALSSVISVIGGSQFVRTPPALYSTIFELASLSPGETFLEVGCGQGHLLAFIGKHATGPVIGIELSPLLVLQSWLRTRSIPNVRIRWQALQKASYAEASAVYCYLLPYTLKRLEKRLLAQLSPGSRITSYAFPFPSLTPTQVVPRTPTTAPVYLYTT